MIEVTKLRGEPHTLMRAPDGSEYSSYNDACRDMIGKGMDPATLVVFRWHTGMAHTNPRPLAYWAARQVVEDDKGIRDIWWRPHPRGNYPDALLRWHAETAAARAAARVVAAEARKPLAVPA